MMKDLQRPRHVGRSIVAVFAGALAGVVLSLGTDLLMHAIGLYPVLGQAMSSGLLVAATVYRCVYSVAGSYLTARLAPSRPMRHALIPGVLGLVASTLGAVTTWNKVPSLGPYWYPIVIMITALPCAWLGGKLRESQLRAKAPRE